MRSYDEYCAIAKSLDVVGDRWTLLIVRELALRGACRYTDVRNGLPGVASNLLAERLRELEVAGVVTREEAPPPIATGLLSLTPRGQQLLPVLDALSRWGMPLMEDQKSDDAVRSHWLASALGRVLRDRQPEAAPIAIELDLGDQPVTIEAGAGEVSVRLGKAERPDTTLTGPARPIMGLLLGRISLHDAEASGLRVEGDRSSLDRLDTDARLGAPT